MWFLYLQFIIHTSYFLHLLSFNKFNYFHIFHSFSLNIDVVKSITFIPPTAFVVTHFIN